MKEKELLNIIIELSYSQGFYGRLYRALMETKEQEIETYKEIIKEWESQNFTTPLDFILYIEG